MDRDSLGEALGAQCFAEVPFPVESTELDQAVQAFFRFLGLPQDIKDHIDFTIAPNHRRGDVGYKHRASGDHVYNDNKDFFHYHPALHDRYRDFLGQNPVVQDFVNRARPIWELAYEAIHRALECFEGDFPGAVARVFETENVHLLLRFLRYEWNESGEYLAKPHFDAGACTLAIAESCPGLRIGSCPEDLKPVTHLPNHALLMLSSNYRQILPSEDFLPGWHDVIQTDQSRIGQSFSRWAVVAFVDAHGVEARPRSETHKWPIS